MVYPCAGCRLAYYCSDNCQKTVWKEHKPVCKEERKAEAEAERRLDEWLAAERKVEAKPEGWLEPGNLLPTILRLVRRFFDVFINILL